MRISLILLFMLFSTCKSVVKVECIEKPSKPQLNKNGTIKSADGQENRRRMKYYNTLQHKNFYRRKK